MIIWRSRVEGRVPMADHSFYEAQHGEFALSTENPGRVIGDVEGPGGPHRIVYDEPEPHGNGEHAPPVTQMFGALVACQLSVLSQCLEKSRVEEYEINANAGIEDRSREDIPEEMPENTSKRIEHITIDIELVVPSEYEDRARRCLDVYDQGCIVGQSYRSGIDYTPTTSLVTK